ncbi:hypothetical protein FEK33_26725 [Nocardia asteroides NBRC 15531]|nr:hypothetical protein [Nocardia asteroides]TLF63593.1 hypothetical protein FEK33_26725 [Nocardia asteroides NBRC 15531]UGT46953.1 hypothetical protein LT345_20785 [Nocardia asteroides]
MPFLLISGARPPNCWPGWVSPGWCATRARPSPPPIRTRCPASSFAAVATAAATAATPLGVWAADVTTSGATVSSPTSLSDDVVLLPKLFRRLADYLELGDGDLSLDGFPAFLTQGRGPLLHPVHRTLHHRPRRDHRDRRPDRAPHPPADRSGLRREMTGAC